MEPTLSIIIAAYNAEKYIAQCLAPLTEFRAVDVEIIVVDDGSTDNTEQIVNSFKDPRLTLLNQSNRGPSAARNAAFRHSRGKFILPFDADDIAIAENWPSMIAALEANTDAVLAFGRRSLIHGDSSEVPSLPSTRAEGVNDAAAFPRIFKGNFLQNTGTAIIRREALEAAGLWNEGLRVGEDWDLWCRLACLGSFLSCPVHVMGYRIHAQSAMGAPIQKDFPDPALEAIETIYAHPMVKHATGASRSTLKRKAIAWQTYHWGTRLIRNGETFAGAKKLSQAITLRPSLLIHILGFPWRRLRSLLALSGITEAISRGRLMGYVWGACLLPASGL
ncbi:glycosyltransferase family 2 protein [Rhodopseudomonas palustris]|uniref:Glycosyltransferase 2-like domain-containing protein n=2 Tax=Rhodopseudomonas TaxID=1073 RepID=A0A0D7F490_RHOPL|nr:glycosyltransferase family 2 protein [Rhodopseudomonas palustris]KIZ47873.1 hypothetical protein OO17_02040 [Rhodopseudomonas palustris]